MLARTPDVGIYSLSYKFFDFLIALPLFLSNAIYPLLLKEKNKPSIYTTTKKYFFIFLAFSLVVLVPFWFVSPIFSLIKSDFVASVIPFRILLFSLPFFYVTSLLQWVLITLGKLKFLMYVYLLSMAVNIFLNLIFIPKYSYVASATITLVSEAIVFTLLIVKIISERNKKIYG
jgi:O-antigen/teichoic acid export membrane protein